MLHNSIFPLLSTPFVEPLHRVYFRLDENSKEILSVLFLSILIYGYVQDRRFCYEIKKIHLKQRESITWILKKEVLKFILAISGFFALFGIGYFLNQYFRFGS